MSDAPHGTRCCHVVLVVVVAALVMSACDWRSALADDPVVAAILGGGSIRGRDPNVVPDKDGGGVLVDRVYVEARARLATDGAVEVGARVNATALSWQPAQRLFHYDIALIGEWWTSTPIGPAEAGISAVRIRARRLGDGNLELAVQTPSGVEVRPRKAELAYESLSVDGWAYTTPVVLTATGEAAPHSPAADASHGGFVDISVSDVEACGLRADRSVECWGSTPPMPDGSYAAVSVPCALRLEGDITCSEPVDGDPQQLGPFVALSDNASPVCGVRPDGSIECWRVASAWAGFDAVAYRHPADALAAVSIGARHGCGLRLDGQVVCWGDNEVLRFSGDTVGTSYYYSGQARAPEGRFAAVSAGAQHSCAIRTNGTVVCWGGNDFGQATPPPGEFTAIQAGGEWFRGGPDFTCGLRPDGTAECWGGHWDLDAGNFEHVPPPAPPGVFTALSGDGGRVCGLRLDDSVDCWWPANREAAGRDHVDLTVDGFDKLIAQTWNITHVPGGQFRALSVGGRHGCGLRPGGAVACWGLDWHGQTDPPAGSFSALTVGGYHSCGLRGDSTVACWGLNTHNQTDAPSGGFVAVSAGWEHSCAVAVSGTVTCWGNNTYDQITAPGGTYMMVDAGGRHTCGLRADGEITCWGEDSHSQSTAPPGAFEAVTTGAQHTCALRVDATVACWGDDRAGQSNPPDGEFSVIGAGADYTCGLRRAGDIVCWGADVNWYPPATPPPTGPFVSLAAGSQIVCGLRADTTAECWPATGRRRTDVPPNQTNTRVPTGTFRAVSAGAHHTCATNTNNRIQCWGENALAQAAPPPGAFEQVAGGDRHTCAISTDGTIHCWGENTFGQTRAPLGRYTTLASGTYHTCALDTAGQIICWGDNTYGQSTPLADTHTAIGAGEHHTCALDTKGAVICWGDNTLEQAEAPDGTYTALAAGRLHTCALHTDGGAVCWGLGYDHDDTNPHDYDTPTTPPPGPFTAITAGARHTCAINTDADVECWPQQGRGGGRYSAGESIYRHWNAWADSRATPPPGPFTAISAGAHHTCAIRPDQTIECWSANEPRTRPQQPRVE